MVPHRDRSESALPFDAAIYLRADRRDAESGLQRGRIDREGSPPVLPRCLNFWMWGASMPSTLNKGSQIEIMILDPKEEFGELLELDIRDQIVDFDRLYLGEAFATAETVLSVVIDHCEQTSDQTKTLYCNDKLVLSQSQLVRPLFAPNAAVSVAGKPRPYSGGICRGYTPPMSRHDSRITPGRCRRADLCGWNVAIAGR